MVLSPTATANYTAEVVVYGVMLNEHPIQPVSCDYRPKRIDRIQHENALEKEAASIILSQNLEGLVQEKGYKIRNTGLKDYGYDGVKSHIIQLPLNGKIVRGQLFINLGSHFGAHSRYNSCTSLYIQLRGNAKLPFESASDYFKQLTETAEGLVNKLVEEYTSVDCKKGMSFYFKGLGLEIPKDHPLRVFFSTEEELQNEMKNNDEIRLVHEELAGIHGEMGKGKSQLKLAGWSNGGSIHTVGRDIDKKKLLEWDGRHAFHYGTILPDKSPNRTSLDIPVRLTWTTFSDIPFANGISNYFLRNEVESLILSNSFFTYNIDFDKLFQ